MQPPVALPKVSSNYLSCGCHAHTTPPPSTFFNIHLHELLSKANDMQINKLFTWFQSDIYRILLSQFIDRISLQKQLTYDQQSYYYNIFNQITNPSLSPNNKDNIDNKEEETVESDDEEEEYKEYKDYKQLPDDVWSRIFQFVDEKTRLLSLPLCSRYIYNISTSPSSWISLQISCSPIYFNFKKSYLFSNFLIKSGRCLTSLVLRDIASMNESHWKHLIDFMTFYCPKIVNVRIRSSITQNGINNHHRNRSSIHNNNNNYNDNNNNNNNHQLIMDNINPSDSLYHQLIGSNLHHHEYHHYFHNKQIENILNYSNAVKSNMFNTLKTFIKHYKKYGGLLIPQNAPHLNNINHANHLQNHRITGNDVDHTSIDDMLGNIMFNMLRNKNNHNDDNTDSNDDESNNDSNDEKKNDNDNNYASYSYSNLFQTLQQKNNDDNKNCYALNPFFYIKRRKHDLFSYFSFSYQIGKYQRNELQPEIHSMHHHGVNNDNNNNINNNHNNNNNHNGNNNNNTNINILESFCSLSLNQLKTNCVIRPKNLCSFLQKQPYLIVLKASVRYRRDWSESENEWFWKIPQCLPSNLEIFFLPGHHALPELWVENCLSNLHNLKYFDFFIVNNKYIPSVSINTIYVLAKHCHQIQFVHLHINLDQYIQKCLKEDERDPYVLFTKELGNALQLLFANCLKLQRVYCYLPIKFDPSLLLQQIVFVQLPSKRKCKLRIDEYKIGGVKCRRFVFKLMDDINSLKSKII